jgi:hypothetical protein
VERAERGVRDAGWNLGDAQQRIADTAQEQADAADEVNKAEVEKAKVTADLAKAQDVAVKGAEELTAAEDKVANAPDRLTVIADATKDMAAAMAATTEGKSSVIGNKFQDLLKQIGGGLLPMFDQILGALSPVLDEVIGEYTKMDELRKKLANAGTGISTPGTAPQASAANVVNNVYVYPQAVLSSSADLASLIREEVLKVQGRNGTTGIA